MWATASFHDLEEKMSVSLMVRWANGESEEVPIMGQRPYVHGWKPIAEKLKLEWVSNFDGGFSVRLEMMGELESELGVFRRELVGMENREYDIEAVDRVLNACNRLRAASGWEASIG